MPKRDALDLTARFVAALYMLTRGKPGAFRRIDDVAQRASIERQADIDIAVRVAERGGLLVVRVDEPRHTDEGGVSGGEGIDAAARFLYRPRQRFRCGREPRSRPGMLHSALQRCQLPPIAWLLVAPELYLS